MKKNMFVSFLAFAIFSLVIAGCGRKQQETQGMLLEETATESPTLVTEETSATMPLEAKKTTVEVSTEAPIAEPQKILEPVAKPSAKEIQQALKNAGFYQGKIDGDIGPLSKQAIKDFQKANNLKVDGAVGLNTWSKLKDYLNMSETASTEIKD